MNYIKMVSEMEKNKTNSKPSICFVAPYVFPVLANRYESKSVGGAEVQQNTLARGLVARGYAVTVIVNDFKQPDELIIDGIRVIKIKTSKKGLPFIRFIHPGMTSLWHALKLANASIYYQRSASWLTGLTGIFCRHNNRRFIYSVAHDLDLDKRKAWSLFNYNLAWRAYYLFQYGIYLTDKIIVQNEMQEKLCISNYGIQPEYIPSCFDVVDQKIESGEVDVIWVGALREWKRPDLYLELAQKLPQVKFVMIGGADVGIKGEEYFNNIARNAENYANLEFRGFLPFSEADKQIANAKVFVNTSDHEGFPNTFLQSWSRGIPTISFVDCGAYDEIGAIGCIVKCMEEMQVMVERLISDEELWLQQSIRCRHYFEKHHSVNSVISKYEKLLKTLGTEKKR